MPIGPRRALEQRLLTEVR